MAETEAEDIELKEYIFTPEEITVNGTKVLDYTKIEQDKVYLCNKKDILTKLRPKWLPEFDPDGLWGFDYLPVCVKDGDGSYFVMNKISKGTEDVPGRYGSMIRRRVYENVVYKMSLDTMTAAIDYYMKRKKAENKENGIKETVRLPGNLKSMATSRYNDMVRLLALCDKYKNDARVLEVYDLKKRRGWDNKDYKRQNIIIFVEQWQPLLQAVKDKKLDMNMQKTDYINTFAKGEETSYGKSGRSKRLLDEYGVMIKMQNGKNMTPSQFDRLSDAIKKVWEHYGSLSKLGKDVDLTLSYADDCNQHARKAVGLFRHDTQSDSKAIGVSFFNDERGKMQPADVILSHEVAHWLDHEKGKDAHRHFASDMEGSLENKIASEFKRRIRNNEKSRKKRTALSPDTKYAELGDYCFRTCECLARAMEEHYALEKGLRIFEENPAYLPEKEFKESIVPMVMELIAENREHFKLEKSVSSSEKHEEIKELSGSADVSEWKTSLLDSYKKEPSRTPKPADYAVYIKEIAKYIDRPEDRLRNEYLMFSNTAWVEEFSKYDDFFKDRLSVQVYQVSTKAVLDTVIKKLASEGWNKDSFNGLPEILFKDEKNNSWILPVTNEGGNHFISWFDADEYKRKHEGWNIEYLNENLEMEITDRHSGLKARSYYNSKDTRKICHDIKKNDPKDIDYKNAVYTITNFYTDQYAFDEKSILVPAPQHTGRAVYTGEIARRIAAKTKASVADILRCRPHDTLYDQKKEGKEPSVELYLENADRETFKFWQKRGYKVYLIDNVISTGLTFNKAAELIPGLIPAPYAIGNFAEITYKDGKYRVNNLLKEKTLGQNGGSMKIEKTADIYKDISFFKPNETKLRQLLKSFGKKQAEIDGIIKNGPDTFNYLRGASKSMDTKVDRYQERIVKEQNKLKALEMQLNLEAKLPLTWNMMHDLELCVRPVDRDAVHMLDKNSYEYYAAVINSVLKNAGLSPRKTIPLVLENTAGVSFNTVEVSDTGEIEVKSGQINSIPYDEFKPIYDYNQKKLSELKSEEINMKNKSENHNTVQDKVLQGNLFESMENETANKEPSKLTEAFIEKDYDPMEAAERAFNGDEREIMDKWNNEQKEKQEKLEKELFEKLAGNVKDFAFGNSIEDYSKTIAHEFVSAILSKGRENYITLYSHLDSKNVKVSYQEKFVLSDFFKKVTGVDLSGSLSDALKNWMDGIEMKPREAENNWKKDETLLSELKAMDRSSRPSSSEWGHNDSCNKIVPGVYLVSTPSHGGLLVHESVAQKIFSPKEYEYLKDFSYNGFISLEKDCNISMGMTVLYEKHLFEGFDWNRGKEEQMYKYSQESVMKWNPGFWRILKDEEKVSQEKSYGVKETLDFLYQSVNQIWGKEDLKKEGMFEVMRGLRNNAENPHYREVLSLFESFDIKKYIPDWNGEGYFDYKNSHTDKNDDWKVSAGQMNGITRKCDEALLEFFVENSVMEKYGKIHRERTFELEKLSGEELCNLPVENPDSLSDYDIITELTERVEESGRTKTVPVLKRSSEFLLLSDTDSLSEMKNELYKTPGEIIKENFGKANYEKLLNLCNTRSERSFAYNTGSPNNPIDKEIEKREKLSAALKELGKEEKEKLFHDTFQNKTRVFMVDGEGKRLAFEKNGANFSVYEAAEPGKYEKIQSYRGIRDAYKNGTVSDFLSDNNLSVITFETEEERNERLYYDELDKNVYETLKAAMFEKGTLDNNAYIEAVDKNISFFDVLNILSKRSNSDGKSFNDITEWLGCDPKVLSAVSRFISNAYDEYEMRYSNYENSVFSHAFSEGSWVSLIPHLTTSESPSLKYKGEDIDGYLYSSDNFASSLMFVTKSKKDGNDVFKSHVFAKTGVEGKITEKAYEYGSRNEAYECVEILNHPLYGRITLEHGNKALEITKDFLSAESFFFNHADAYSMTYDRIKLLLEGKSENYLTQEEFVSRLEKEYEENSKDSIFFKECLTSENREAFLALLKENKIKLPVICYEDSEGYSHKYPKLVEGKIYSFGEFDEILKEYDPDGIRSGHGYDKSYFTLVDTDGELSGMRYDIGDGEGGLIRMQEHHIEYLKERVEENRGELFDNEAMDEIRDCEESLATMKKWKEDWIMEKGKSSRGVVLPETAYKEAVSFTKIPSVSKKTEEKASPSADASINNSENEKKPELKDALSILKTLRDSGDENSPELNAIIRQLSKLENRAKNSPEKKYSGSWKRPERQQRDSGFQRSQPSSLKNYVEITRVASADNDYARLSDRKYSLNEFSELIDKYDSTARNSYKTVEMNFTVHLDGNRSAVFRYDIGGPVSGGIRNLLSMQKSVLDENIRLSRSEDERKELSMKKTLVEEVLNLCGGREKEVSNNALNTLNTRKGKAVSLKLLLGKDVFVVQTEKDFAQDYNLKMLLRDSGLRFNTLSKNFEGKVDGDNISKLKELLVKSGYDFNDFTKEMKQELERPDFNSIVNDSSSLFENIREINEKYPFYKNNLLKIYADLVAHAPESEAEKMKSLVKGIESKEKIDSFLINACYRGNSGQEEIKTVKEEGFTRSN